MIFDSWVVGCGYFSACVRLGAVIWLVACDADKTLAIVDIAGWEWPLLTMPKIVRTTAVLLALAGVTLEQTTQVRRDHQS